MAIEAAVSEVGRPHDVGDADAAEALGAKQAAGRIKDALAGLGGFFPAHSHMQASAMHAKTAIDNLYDAHHQYATSMMMNVI